jgi:Na+-translocating ferredoxin:NAD+ oxidoreductase subunit E
MNKYVERIYNGIIKENPTVVQFLGMCPTLAVTTSAINGIGMGLSTTAVLVFSNMLISALRKIIPDKVRVPGYIVVVASLVTIVQFLMEGFVPSLYSALGIYIPLIVVNCIILGRAESYASKNPIGLSIMDGLGMGLGFTLSLTVIGMIREILGGGQIFGFQILPLADASTGTIGYTPIIIFILAPGAFFVLAALVAIRNWVLIKQAEKGKATSDVVVCEMNCAACSAACGGKMVFDGLVKDVAQTPEKKAVAKPAPKKEEAPKAEAAKTEEAPKAETEAKEEVENA